MYGDTMEIELLFWYVKGYMGKLPDTDTYRELRYVVSDTVRGGKERGWSKRYMEGEILRRMR